MDKELLQNQFKEYCVQKTYYTYACSEYPPEFRGYYIGKYVWHLFLCSFEAYAFVDPSGIIEIFYPKHHPDLVILAEKSGYTIKKVEQR